MLKLIKEIEPGEIEDETMREQLVALQGFSHNLMEP